MGVCARQFFDKIKLADYFGVMDYFSVQTAEQFALLAPLPELSPEHIHITVEGNSLCIVARPSARQAPIEGKIKIPRGYRLDQAQATYLNGQLRIVIPKAAISRG